MSHVGNDAELGNFHDHEDEDLTDEDEADEAIFFQGIEDKLNALEKNTPSFANQANNLESSSANKDMDEKENESQPKKPKTSKRPVLDVIRLLDPTIGIPHMLDSFSKRIQLRDKPGMEHYDAWMDSLMPTLAIPNVVSTIERLGHTAAVRRYISDLRLRQAVANVDGDTGIQSGSFNTDSDLVQQDNISDIASKAS
eukprot:gene8878-1229_t